MSRQQTLQYTVKIPHNKTQGIVELEHPVHETRARQLQLTSYQLNNAYVQWVLPLNFTIILNQIDPITSHNRITNVNFFQGVTTIDAMTQTIINALNNTAGEQVQINWTPSTRTWSYNLPTTISWAKPANISNSTARKTLKVIKYILGINDLELSDELENLSVAEFIKSGQSLPIPTQFVSTNKIELGWTGKSFMTPIAKQFPREIPLDSIQTKCALMFDASLQNASQIRNYLDNNAWIYSEVLDDKEGLDLAYIKYSIVNNDEPLELMADTELILNFNMTVI